MKVAGCDRFNYWWQHGGGGGDGSTAAEAAMAARQRRRGWQHGSGGTAMETARSGGGVFARGGSSRGPLFYELAESWRGGASARALSIQEKGCVCRN